jgi:glyoxylase-like metal-dependent hydrolase (beta-lactamase superfamily II)
MIIKTIVVGELDTNCYIAASERTKEALIIDPGDEAGKIIKTIEEDGLRPVLIVNTHMHPDHFGANEELIKRYGIPAAAGQSEKELIDKWGLHFKYFAGADIRTLGLKKVLNEGDTVSIGELKFSVIRTPGHAESGICLLGEGVLFSGDTLFYHDSGRTDIPGADEKDMEASLEKLMRLPENIKVYPGHGRSTTISKEAGLYAKH